ncbi:Respiratory nitrate reductase delta chain OS=Castellaniella defragrans (strain DSM / CCUG 39792/ 65Phen) OX=1437824 GN=BN940_15751 PE=4 SV=1 [Castellaniella denitrificans]|uniref:nitrate reductase molybdenum cofactor assembly chaperone n=1 Tax=Castellaniella sp. TaxID=1955812 RepID=UPI002AFEAD4C|nr:nitrate reductase molybdenum cofactor assembly chaperone [Castellaniella sp.]
MDTITTSRAAPVYSVLSVLLGYPEREWLDALPELSAALPAEARARLAPLFAFLEQDADLIDLQEQYVAIFDRRSAHSLHLFEHVHGESRDRGQAMVDLRNEYLKHGLEPATTELPDYVPLFLEFLGQIPAQAAEDLLGDAIHVLARLGDKLAEADSPYACLFAQLRTMTDVQPEVLPDPPEGDMEETLVTFGPEADGTEPLLMRRPGRGDGVQPIVFHPPRSRQAGPAGGQA